MAADYLFGGVFMGLADRDYYREELERKLRQLERPGNKPLIKKSYGSGHGSGRGSGKKKSIPWGLVITIIVLIMVAYNSSKLYFKERGMPVERLREHVKTPGIPSLFSPRDVFLKEEPLPENGSYKLFLPSEQYVASLKIIADPFNNYIVKLKDLNKQPVLYLFIRAGNTTEIKAPLGTYEFLWISGKKWYGYDKLFGSSSTYMKSIEPIDFNEEITLTGKRIMGRIVSFKTINGNMPSTQISSNEF
jgi:hypothetical protein